MIFKFFRVENPDFWKAIERFREALTNWAKHQARVALSTRASIEKPLVDRLKMKELATKFYRVAFPCIDHGSAK